MNLDQRMKGVVDWQLDTQLATDEKAQWKNKEWWNVGRFARGDVRISIIRQIQRGEEVNGGKYSITQRARYTAQVSLTSGLEILHSRQ